MKNVIENFVLYIFCFIHLTNYIYYTYKIDNIIIKETKFSNILGNTIKKVNKYYKESHQNYDVCKYKKIPKILIEKNKFKDKKIKYIVGIENTCDDTCVCVIDSNLNIIINVIISHFKIVHKYEGVYPFFISSINNLFLKHYVDKILNNINKKKINCYGLSVCPGIAKNMEAAKNYIEEIKKNNKIVKISSVNHIFAHVLSPLFFPFYTDVNTYTNRYEYKEKNLNKIENENFININMSEIIKNDKNKEKVKEILEVLNKNIVTKQKSNNLNEQEFLNYASYILKKEKKEDKENISEKNEDKENINEKKEDKENISEKKENENLNKFLTGYLKDGYICVLVSGGSTEVYIVKKNIKNDICISKISKTVDMSVGDIIDKIARDLELPVGLGGGPFLEMKAKEFIEKLKRKKMNEEICDDPFQPFPTPFSPNNIINFSFSGIFNHLSKIIKKLKKEKSFEIEKDRYAYYCQKNIFSHILKQLNKIMYFSELHFNIKNLCIVGGVGCNNFLYQSLKNLALRRDNKEYQIKEYNKLKKRLKKKIKKIGEEKFEVFNISEHNQEKENELNSSLVWKIYLNYLLKKKSKDDILSYLKSFNFEDFMKLKNNGYFLLEDSTFLNNSNPWKIYKTPLNLSRDNAAMICFNTFLNLHNKINIHQDTSEIKIKPTVTTKLENNFLLLSDIIIFDVYVEYFDNKKI
ncbi:tRNA N6-adenosine threonylcarbamoyltransferase, putative [Plasmodium gallinaceum]|uniref:tRNA N6-adenosine threonylcarbamoyltransferase, putative n=1 Tax=Plasmodium gallinaceum TaxID=5849 RepID=A0A1J1H005_PLAGA|nr:tRNA N6-adenosine threonylcarbamoyltransferase, putative [Plasmodium gallinaceum]CRG98160.1 tRNA N6-adenosine threonylcarbamoyltransferase, putative [Plasmodium gallinaceum]